MQIPFLQHHCCANELPQCKKKFPGFSFCVNGASNVTCYFKCIK